MTDDQNGAPKPWVDPDDASELTREWFERADFYEGGKLIRRGWRRKEGTSKAALYKSPSSVPRK